MVARAKRIAMTLLSRREVCRRSRVTRHSERFRQGGACQLLLFVRMCSKCTGQGCSLSGTVDVPALVDDLLGVVFSARASADWPLTSVSRGCVSLTGYTPAELLGNEGSSETLTG